MEIIEQFKPQSMAVEQLFSHYKHPRTAILMAHARGVILLAAAQYKLSVTSYNPTRVKKSLTGSGRAGKLQVQWAIQRELGLVDLPEPSDVADAMAIGLTHIHAISIEKPELL
jgi:crossover junction endodeoxyribonuclease RuvC